MRESSGGRAQRGARLETSIGALNAALLIDFDNVTMGIRSDLQNQLRKLLNSDVIKGKVSVQRAYADWRRYPQYIVPLSEASIDLIFAPAFGANKKNATDIRLAIDALELIFTRPEIGVFILLSGDSDFSALVLKLKEYGKYVIGVGIRESSSDLLIQNCDEYYSYSEITGLSREGEIEHIRKDPWALAVEAARQMESEGDVMRSDRLKQVMQSMDPNFDERDVGFNKFSKFVVAAGQRGLLSLSKMDNGQFAVELGPNANVPSGEVGPRGERATADKGGDKSRRRSSHRPTQPSPGGQLTLSESFELIRQALSVLEAVGGNATDAERARAKMIELLDSDADPALDPRRFPRLLRQAHDAGLIELIKSDGGGYLLKLSDSEPAVSDEMVDSGEPIGSASTESESKTTKKPRTPRRRKKSTAKAEQASEAKDAAEQADIFQDNGAKDAVAAKRRNEAERSARASEEQGTAETTERVSEAKAASSHGADRNKARTSTRRSPRSRARTSSKAAEASSAAGKGADTVAAEAVASVPGGGSDKESSTKRNPRYRRGSRGGSPRARPPADENKAPTEPEAIARGPVQGAQTEGRRSLGLRRGSKGGTPAPTPSSPAKAGAPVPPVPPADRPARSGVHEVSPTPPVASEPVHVPDSEPGEAGGGLFKRITAAFQRAVQGEQPRREDDTQQS